MLVPDNSPTNVHALAKLVLRLALLRNDADTAQWEPAPVPKARDDTSERAKGGYSNPTALTVLDGRRLALRESVQETDQAAAEALALLSPIYARLAASLASWSGEQDITL